MDLKNFLLYESICNGVAHSLRARREATSKRERESHLRSVVNLLDILDFALGR